MPSMSRKLDQQLEHSKQIMFGTSVYSQPWWGNNISFSNGDVSHGQDQKHLKDTPPPKPPSTDEQFQMNSQMELVGHSIVLTSSLYSDPQCGGLLNSLGPGSMVQQLYGMHHARIPLPLEMEEEPVYVNPKQYHGILRRRQSRAKAELEQKVLKARKPYLHESRHQHAMRRPRGSGGRFLNKKKLDSNASSDEAGNSSNDLSLQSPNLSISQIEDSTEDMLEIHARANGHGFSRVQLVDLNGLRGGPHGPTHNN